MKIEIPSRERWVDTGVDVEAGERVTLSATGVWVDFYIPCSADGYDATAFYVTGLPPRIPDEQRYFRLMGRIVPDRLAPVTDDPKQTFVIGSQTILEAPSSGRLFVFCNDRDGHYGNNWGSVSLSVERAGG